MVRAASLVAGILVGALLAYFSTPRSVRTLSAKRHRRHRAHNLQRAPLPNAGDLAAPDALAHALSVRASSTREIIFMLTDEHHVRLALNLLLNLDELRLHHHLVIAKSAAVCKATGLSLGCGHSTFLQRGTSARTDAGLAAYSITDDHVYHLWWQRWFFLSEAVSLGYSVLSLDTDVSLRADPYPLLHGALAHHDLITGLDNDQALRPFYFPAANVGFVYARGRRGTGAHWVLSECRRRLERLLSGEIVPLPEKAGVSQQIVWDQDTFKDVLETAAFTPSAPSYRHAQGHCMGRHVRSSAARFAPPLPDGWSLRVEMLRFFANESRPALPSAWLPLHVPPDATSGGSSGGGTSSGSSGSSESDSGGSGGRSSGGGRIHTQWISSSVDALAVAAFRSSSQASNCNGTRILAPGSSTAADVGDGRWDPWTHGSSGVRVGRARRSGSFAALPMWLFSTYQICPHGDVCDGRWGRRGAPPVLIGHLVGVKAKFWILRMLGWWHYDAARPPSDDEASSRGGRAAAAAGASESRAAPEALHLTDDAVSAKAGAFAGRRRSLVFPAASVRPLVLRGHSLRIGAHAKPEAIATARTQLARFVLLALALNRRAIVPLVPCEIPTPETPVELRSNVALLKLTDRTACEGRDARNATWVMPATIAPEASHERLHLTKEMGAMGDYSRVMTWPPPRAPSCCSLIPELKCIDKYGEYGELRDEVMLSERDYGWLLREEKDEWQHSRRRLDDAPARSGEAAGEGLSRAVVVPVHRAPLTLATLRAHRAVRTLVVDLQDSGNADGASADPLALLPPAEEVEEMVSRALRARRGQDGVQLPPRAHKCVRMLLAISEEARAAY